MKAILWADVHTEHSVKNDNVKGERTSSLVLDVLEEHALKEKPDWIVSLGDFFDKHGMIESTLAVHCIERAQKLREAGSKIIFLTGNHEYQEVKDQYFGKGMLTALFGDKEDEGIYVIDAKAKFIRMDETTVFLGIPYRETYPQFERDCLTPIKEALEAGEARPGVDKILVGWHVGLPFGTTWRGIEAENSWITEDSEAVKFLFGLAHDRRIFLGHYHGPDDLPCGNLGTFSYVGSPATRSRSESGQDKRVAVWEDGNVRFHSTELHLDAIVSSVEEAEKHLNDLIARFGEDVIDVATIHVKLPDDASMDDYNVARIKASKIGGMIMVDRVRINKKGLCDHIIEQHMANPESTRESFELDIFNFSVKNHFRSGLFKKSNDRLLEAVVKIPYRQWKDAARASLNNDAALSTLCDALKEKLRSEGGLTDDDLPEFSLEFLNQAASLSLTSEVADQISMSAG